MSAKTEPKTHSPAAAAAHSPAEAPAPIPFCKLCSVDRADELSCGFGDNNHFYKRARGESPWRRHFQDPGPRPPPNPRRGPQNPSRRERREHATGPPRAPYSRRSDRTARRRRRRDLPRLWRRQRRAKSYANSRSRAAGGGECADHQHTRPSNIVSGRKCRGSRSSATRPSQVSPPCRDQPGRLLY